MTATFSSDLSGRVTDFPHFWEHTVGSGHATLGFARRLASATEAGS